MPLQVITGLPTFSEAASTLIDSYTWDSNIDKQEMAKFIWNFSLNFTNLRQVFRIDANGRVHYYLTVLAPSQFEEFIKRVEQMSIYETADSVNWELQFGTLWTSSIERYNQVYQQLNNTIETQGYIIH